MEVVTEVMEGMEQPMEALEVILADLAMDGNLTCVYLTFYFYLFIFSNKQFVLPFIVKQSGDKIRSLDPSTVDCLLQFVVTARNSFYYTVHTPQVPSHST